MVFPDEHYGDISYVSKSNKQLHLYSVTSLNFKLKPCKQIHTVLPLISAGPQVSVVPLTLRSEQAPSSNKRHILNCANLEICL